MKKYVLILSIVFLASCGSSGALDSNSINLDMTLNQPNILVSLDSEFYGYQFLLYNLIDGEVGEKLFGPSRLVSLNTDTNLFRGEVSDIISGEYVIEVQLVRSDDALVLLGAQENIALEGENISVDLTGLVWDLENYDADSDGVSNYREVLVFGSDPTLSDTDGDGVSDNVDAFPINPNESFDFDGDGKSDSQDSDIDNDGLSNEQEVEIGTSPINPDSDADSVLDGEDNCPLAGNSSQKDQDEDGLGDDCDDDIDGDGISNEQEKQRGLDEYNSDTDDDGVSDGADTFPSDPAETQDSDSDGIGDNADNDDDNDGLTDDEESVIGSDAKSEDTDGDTIRDSLDNCPIHSNVAQQDNDEDGLGDECDLDDDNDGLVDSEENSVGEDGFLTNSKLSDSDGDGFTDPDDNCPLESNIDQIDTDADGFGDACDCGSNDPEIHQLSSDYPDPAKIDSNCDGIDGNKYEAIFISPNGGASTEATSPSSPTSSFQEGLAYAYANGLPVFLAAGDYNITELEYEHLPSIYGGFSNTFLDRDTTGELYQTRLISNESNDDLAILSVEDSELTLAGITFENQSDDESQILLYIRDSQVTLENNVFSGNEDIYSEVLLLGSNSTINLTANQFYGNAIYDSLGVDFEDSSGVMKNNIFAMGEGNHTQAMALDNSDFVISNNTIDGGRHSYGSSYGVTFQTISPSFYNNIFITENDNMQASLACTGVALESDVILSHNLFFRFTTTTSNFGALVDCNGGVLNSETDLESSDGVSSSNNQVITQSDSAHLASVLDEESMYSLVSGSMAIDAGTDTSNSNKGAVRYDFLGSQREALSYDIGAFEYE